MPRRKRTPTPIPEPDPLPPGLVLGALVRYYKDAWYNGYLESVKGHTAKIVPILGGPSISPNRMSVPLEDVRPISTIGG